VSARFKSTTSFECLEYLVDCALDLKQQYISFALVLYYRFVEKVKSASSSLEQCRYDALYVRIVRHFPDDLEHAKQIRFVDFQEKLERVRTSLEDCLEHEVKLLEYLINDDNKAEVFPEQALLQRNEDKLRVQAAIDSCA
jgi:hypothetical protein